MPLSSPKPHSNFQVLVFITSLCFFCAFILAITAFSLEKVQQNAKEFDQSKQMLIAAKILNHAGYFETLQDHCFVRARFDKEKQILISDPTAPKAAEEQIKWIAAQRIRPLLTDNKGNIFTFEEKILSLKDYLTNNKKGGFAHLPLKLFYAILPNEENVGEITADDLRQDPSKASIFVIPVCGFGLWAPIYGYIALAANAQSVIGTTWYEHAETPGLGANITEPWWQKQFFGKIIFQESLDGTIDFHTADIGIIVVKGQVKDVFGAKSKSKSAVDGMSGATLTGDGVTAAYQNSLNPYRELLIQLHTKAIR